MQNPIRRIFQVFSDNSYAAGAHVPGCSAVPVQHVEVLARQQLASVDPRLDGSETPQDPDLLHVANERHDVQTLQLRVNGMQPPHEMLQEQLERLRQAQHRLALDDESGDLLSAIVDQLALVGGGVRRRYGRRAVVWSGRCMMMSSSHEFERWSVMHHL